jgi:hypothetical protein
MVIAVDGYATAAGRQGLEIVSESVDGRIFYVLRDLDSGNEVHYTYSSGYLVAAPARVLVSQALEYQQTRYSLGTASAFRDLFPAGGEEDCSAVIYQNMTHLVSSVTSYLDLVGETADSEELGMIQGIAQDGPPTLACVVAEPDRIIVSNQGELPFNLFTLGGLSALMEALPEVSP